MRKFQGDGGAFMQLFFGKNSQISMSWCYLDYCQSKCCIHKYNPKHEEKIYLKYPKEVITNEYTSQIKNQSFCSKPFLQDELWRLQGGFYFANGVLKVGVKNKETKAYYPIIQTVKTVKQSKQKDQLMSLQMVAFNKKLVLSINGQNYDIKQSDVYTVDYAEKQIEDRQQMIEKIQQQINPQQFNKNIEKIEEQH